MIIATVWEKFDTKTAVWMHNHLEYGFSKGQKPYPKFDLQKSWAINTWIKSVALIINNRFYIIYKSKRGKQ